MSAGDDLRAVIEMLDPLGRDALPSRCDPRSGRP
jgi:hypothetical protein